MNFESTIHSMIRRAKRRLFIQRLLQYLPFSIAISFFLAACLSSASILTSIPAWLWLSVIAPEILCIMTAIPWRTSHLDIAQAIDSANQFDERLSSCIEFFKQPSPSDWMLAQRKDTANRLTLPEIQTQFIKKTFPILPPALAPQSIVLCISAILIFATTTLLNDSSSSTNTSISNSDNIQNTTAAQSTNLNPIDSGMHEKQLQDLIQNAQNNHDDELESYARDLMQILKDDKDGKLNAEEFQQRMQALQEKIQQSTSSNATQQAAIDQAVRDAAQAMVQMKEDPDTQNLASALENNDYDKAADILKNLLNSTDPKNQKQLEKIAKMLGNLAKNIDPTDPKLKEALKKNKSLIRDLKNTLDSDKLSQTDRENLKKAEQKLKTSPIPPTPNAQNPNAKKTQATQTLQNLQNALNRDAKNLQNKASNAEIPNNDATRQPLTNNADNPNSPNAPSPTLPNPSEKMNDLTPNPPTPDNANHTDTSPANTSQTEEQLRNMAKQQQKQAQRDALNDIANKIKNNAQQNDANNAQDNQQQMQRQKNMQDFLERAKGNTPHKSPNNQPDANDQKQSPNPAQTGQTPQNATKNAQNSNANPQQQTDGNNSQAEPSKQQTDGNNSQAEPSKQQTDGNNSQTERSQRSGNSSGSDSQQTEQPGNTAEAEHGTKGGHDETSGNATNLNVNFKNEKLSAIPQTTTSAIIESSGQSGFASEPYREIYQSYEKAAESILESEEIPQGYKSYVEKYFEMIHPQN